MKIKKTKRGFAIGRFTDRYGVKCSIQKSSLAFESAIWFGADDIGLQEFTPNGNPSWKAIDTSEPGRFVANNRMHLTQKQVKKLLPILQRFVETGEIHERQAREA